MMRKAIITRENWISKEKWKEEKIYLSFPSTLWSWASVFILFGDCGTFSRQQLLLLHPLLWSNPSLSCAVCLSDHYRIYSGPEAASSRGLASSDNRLLWQKRCNQIYYKNRAGVHLSLCLKLNKQGLHILYWWLILLIQTVLVGAFILKLMR